jgi:hypothetical protein
MATKKKTEKKTEKTEKKSIKTYAGMKGLLAAQGKGTLPRGVKVRVSKECVVFVDRAGNELAEIDAATFIKGELKRHGFKVAD